MKHKDLTKLVLFSILTIAAGMTLNVYLHELGHYVVADQLGMNPEMHFDAPVEIDYGAKAVRTNPAPAYVSYDSIVPEYTYNDALIAISGPLVNGFLMLFFGGLFLAVPRKHKNSFKSSVLSIFFVIALLSIILNIIPIAPSDGYVVASYILG